MSTFSPCDFLYERWRNLAMWRNLWSILLFLVGTALALFLVAALLMFINKVWLAGALSTVATIANGVALNWIVVRRNQAVAEETEAKEDLLANCGGPQPGAAELDPAPYRSVVPGQLDVESVEQRLRLFGRFR